MTSPWSAPKLGMGAVLREFKGGQSTVCKQGGKLGTQTILSFLTLHPCSLPPPATSCHKSTRKNFHWPGLVYWTGWSGARCHAIFLKLVENLAEWQSAKKSLYPDSTFRKMAWRRWQQQPRPALDPGGRLGAELVVLVGWQEVAGGGSSNNSHWPDPDGRLYAELPEGVG
jgi:hypothetical protein